MNNTIAFILISVTVLLTACSDESIPASDNSLSGKEYFPLEIGKYVTYQADSVTYAIEGSKVDSSSTIVKEELTDILVSEIGDTSFILTRYQKQNENDPFEITDIWSTAFKDGFFTKTEENIKLIKLSLPVKLDKSWDPTAFIDENINVQVKGESLQPYRFWNASVVNEYEIFTVNGQEYTEVVEVNFVNNTDFIEQRIVNEWYAAGIGLIKQEMSILDTQCDNCSELPWVDKAEKGFISSLEIIDHN